MPVTTDDRPLWVLAMLYLRGEQYRVWSYLYWRQGSKPDAWPSQTRMAADLGLTVRYIKRIVRTLAGDGWLQVTWPRGPGRGREHVKRYVVTCPEKVNASSPIEIEKRGTTEHLLTPEKGNTATKKRGTTVPPNTIQRTLPTLDLDKTRFLSLTTDLMETLQARTKSDATGIRARLVWAMQAGEETFDELIRKAIIASKNAAPGHAIRYWYKSIDELGYKPAHNRELMAETLMNIRERSGL